MTDYGVTAPAAPTTAPSLEKAETPGASPLDRMRAMSKESIERFPLYKVAGREGLTLEFSNAIDPEDLKRYQKNAQGKKKDPKDADQVLASAQILQEASRAMYLNGDQLVSPDGSEWTLAHEEFIAMYGGMGAVEAIKQLLGGGQLLTMSGKLVEEAGYGAEIESADPMKP